MTHDEARIKVCAVCTNQWGDKAVRRVNQKEETLIKLHILQNYSSENMYFPSGICLHSPSPTEGQGGRSQPETA